MGARKFFSPLLFYVGHPLGKRRMSKLIILGVMLFPIRLQLCFDMEVSGKSDFT